MSFAPEAYAPGDKVRTQSPKLKKSCITSITQVDLSTMSW